MFQKSKVDSNLEKYFHRFRKNIIGIDHTIQTPYGEKKLVYADWIASGRLYQSIEEIMHHHVGPMVGNTHTESSETGRIMTSAYHYAQEIIKKHINAGPEDKLLSVGSGMTDAISKLIRILGVTVPEYFSKKIDLAPVDRPVVFVTHMEHHSNQIPWQESIADVVVLEAGDDLLVDPEELRKKISFYKQRPLKIGAFSACSNVTGIQPPYYKLAEIMHEYGGYCFVDFAASAPYVDIDMHPDNKPSKQLDAVIFSPHKFLGGPGSAGILVFNKQLYNKQVPDSPGGGTVTWTNPWGGRSYLDDIELREDGGTPGFLQTIRAALSIELKEEMGTDAICKREEHLLKMAFSGLQEIEGLHLLAGDVWERLGILSFYIVGVHYNLMVRLLNDRYGIQVRGGCSCAGTYGHFLLNVDQNQSRYITNKIDQGDYSEKPGWVRLSLHPTMTDFEVAFIISAIREITENIEEWAADYTYDSARNEFTHRKFQPKDHFETWFNINRR